MANNEKTYDTNLSTIQLSRDTVTLISSIVPRAIKYDELFIRLFKTNRKFIDALINQILKEKGLL